ncbi:MAG TPA: 4a-hydroxytetrahydrobiopterin dehydratase [Anaerolineales bacterium]|nr:4a-hydroxytetrahydrobiopterin dehydratase [Anaerolineales bacterium]
MELATEKCVSLRGGGSTLSEAEIQDLLLQIQQWGIREVDGMKRLERVFKFKNFAEAMEFTNEVATIAEAEDHHPLIITEWGKVTINWWSHKIGGLHRNDFIMAAKTDALYH